MSNRKIMHGTLAGYLATGVTQAMVTGGYPFGRNADKSEVADTVNEWRAQIRWRHRMQFSDDVGPVTASITQNDIDGVKLRNANNVATFGPNEIDFVGNWKYHYLNYNFQPDEITTSTPFSSIQLSDTIFSGNLSLLFLRIADMMKHYWFAVNDSLSAGGSGRTDVAVLAPSLIACRLNPLHDFTIYDWFDWEDTSANVGLHKGDWLQWCDVGQVHIHQSQHQILDPWQADPAAPIGANGISPYHWWTAKLANEAYRAANNLPILQRPLMDGESGRAVMGAGTIVTGRTSLDLAHIRRLMWGQNVVTGAYWGECVKLLFCLGNCVDYGYNTFAYGTATQTLNSIATATLATAGTGYSAGGIYSFNGFSGRDIAPQIKVMTIGGGGAIATFQIVYTGYGLGITTSPLTLAAPSGGTSATFNVTWSTPARFSKIGDLGEYDTDYFAVVADPKHGDIDGFTSTGNLSWSIPIVAKTWQSYWKDWLVWFNQAQDPIDGPSTTNPFTEWNFVTFAANLITMSNRSGRNLVMRLINSRYVAQHAPSATSNGIVGVPHTFTVECRLSSSATGRARVEVRGYNKLNGLVSVVSATVIGVAGTGTWTPLTVTWTHVPHNNPKLPDPLTSVLLLDHNGSGTCEWRNANLAVSPV